MPAPPRPRARVVARSAIALALSCSAARGDDVENYRRLEDMPPERRAALAENLAEFDRLGDRDRATVRRLDRELSRRDPIDQARFRALIRRYHAWSSGLSEQQRQALRETTSPEARLDMVHQILAKQKAATADGPRISGLRLGDLGLIGPHEAAFLLQVWNKLPDDKKKAVATLRGEKLAAALRAEADRVKVAYRPFPAELRRAFGAKIEADPALKALAEPPTGKPGTEKEAGGAAAKAAEKTPRRVDDPYAEFLYFEAPENRPRPVPPHHFARFQAACPPWLLEMLDPLSPDDARAYLAILYRLLYPHPAEMPEAAPAAPKAAPKAAPRPPTGPTVPL